MHIHIICIYVLFSGKSSMAAMTAEKEVVCSNLSRCSIEVDPALLAQACLAQFWLKGRSIFCISIRYE